MNHSDDYPSDIPSSTNPPFSGDETGSIFDVVEGSPATTERVVDTQSGFLVVVKPLQSRLTLSVKRRLGTPPVSYITLTPDESIKLSKILGSVKELTAPAKRGFLFGKGNDNKKEKEWQEQSESVIESTSATLQSHENSAAGRDEFDGDSLLDTDPSAEFARYAAAGKKKQLSYRERRAARQTTKVTGGQIVTVCVCLIAIPALIWASAFLAGKHSSAPKPVPLSELEHQRIDQFSRDFIADMLDFNPSTYRASQIRAMAAMTPTLIDKYWKETNFPLTDAQLKKAPHNQTLVISNVEQSEAVENRKKVDVFAELVNSDTQKKRPVHLRLTVENNGQLLVLSQEDLSSAK